MTTALTLTEARARARPASGVQIVARLRAKHFADCPELPDAVILATAAKADKTRESIRYNYAAWRRWLGSQRSRHKAFPADPLAIVRYLQDHAPPIVGAPDGGLLVDPLASTARGTTPLSYATLQRFLAVLATLHREAEIDDPTKHPAVMTVWRLLRRALRRPRQKARLGLESLQSAVAALPSTVEGKRDRAVLLIAYALMARRSELVALNDDCFERHTDGSVTVRFRRTKTGGDAENHLPPPIVKVLDEWLAVRPCGGPATFVRLDRAGRLQRLAAASVAAIMRRAVKAAALPIDPREIGGHSARIGAAYDLALAGAPDSAIMRDGGWKTQTMVAAYTRGARAREGALALLLERRLGKT